jgi:hypothetical protein
VEDVLAASKLDARLLSQAGDVADSAQFVFILILEHLDSGSLVELLNAINIEARQASLFAFKSSAPVTARQLLITALFSDLHTVFFFAACLERWSSVFRWPFELFEAEPARLRVRVPLGFFAGVP